MKKKTVTPKIKTIPRQRMYHLISYSLSDKQKGIQAYHSGIEYWLKYPSLQFKQWAKNDKTLILLDGGTTNDLGYEPYGETEYTGTLQMYKETLEKNGIPVVSFQEPDVNNATTALAFLLDEYVWDKKKYPNPPEYIYDKSDSVIADNNIFWVSRLYGKQTAFLREFIKQFKLA